MDPRWKIGFSGFVGVPMTLNATVGQWDNALRPLGLLRGGPPQQSQYAESYKVGFASDNKPALSVSVSPDEAHFVMYPIGPDVVDAYGTDAFANVLFAIASSSNALIARTWGESGWGTPTRADLATPVDWLEWFQYFGPAIASRWAGVAVAAGPIHRVLSTSAGALALWLAPSPYDRFAIRPAAAHLGIELRPMINPQTGERLNVP